MSALDGSSRLAPAVPDGTGCHTLNSHGRSPWTTAMMLHRHETMRPCARNERSESWLKRVLINGKYTKEYFDIIDGLEGDLPGRRAAARFMRQSSAIVHGEVTPSTFVPRLYGADSRALFVDATATISSILGKVMDRFVEDGRYRALFDFDDRIVELALAPRGYGSHIPIARFDLFLNEETDEWYFCEFNTDGTSGMNENREIFKSIEGSPSYRLFCERHRTEPDELFDSWIDTFLSVYRSSPQAASHPTVAICDYLDHSTTNELEVYRERFNERGVDCRVIDVRALRFEERSNALLDSDGRTIDAVWRRFVCRDVLERWDESRALISAVLRGATVLIGGFLNQVAHDKRVFRVLRDPLTQAFLSEAEREFVRRHIPFTEYLDCRVIDVDAIAADKDSWVIKPTDDYGASDVFVGAMYSEGEWREIVGAHADGRGGRPFLAQRFVSPYATLTMPAETPVDLDDSEVSRRKSRRAPRALYNNLTGLYAFDGKLSGVFSRLGPRAIVCGPYGGVTAATVWVDC